MEQFLYEKKHVHDKQISTLISGFHRYVDEISEILPRNAA
jgi:hypothetical protein